MLTEKQLETAIAQIMARLGEVNQVLIKKIAVQIKRIKQLNTTSINRIIAMVDMGADIQGIDRALATATALNIRDIYAIYQMALNESYTDQRFAAALKTRPLTMAQSERLTLLAQNVATQTATAMYNLSNTTAIMPAYRNAVDRAITAVSMGGMSYNEAARDIIRDLGYSGLQVYYESGYHRRLDTAVRQNIIDGVNQINQNASLAIGEALGYDAVEISAHANSAPDHEPVQGRVFLLSEFEKMQSGLSFQDVDGNTYEGFPRAIGEWNCMHIAMSFDTKTSIRRFTDEQLQEFKDNNAKGCDVGGKHYTIYEARQLMRQLETKVRREKDAAVAAKLNGNDMDERRARQRVINALSAKYYAVAQAAGLTPRGQRLSVEGFRAVSV
ncbi:MAG: hypothetical protein IKE17_05945 [Clostridia bacterium]|nr:hypothetical protein [Clostridia bacterium]